MYIHSYKRVIKLQNQGQESYQNVDFELENATVNGKITYFFASLKVSKLELQMPCW